MNESVHEQAINTLFNFADHCTHVYCLLFPLYISYYFLIIYLIKVIYCSLPQDLCDNFFYILK